MIRRTKSTRKKKNFLVVFFGWIRYTDCMVDKGKQDWLIMKLYEGEDCEPYTYMIDCPKMEDAELEIDDWKNILDRRLTRGILTEVARATFTWFHSESHFINDSWSA